MQFVHRTCRISGNDAALERERRPLTHLAALTGRHAMADSTPEQTIYQIVSDDFWRMIDKSGSCWMYTGTLNNWGYGQFRIGSKRVFAHRLAWMLTHGSIPEGLLVCHNCPDGDNPACANPAHLYLGTHKQNMQDMVRKGRNRTGMPAKLSFEKADEIRSRYAEGGISTTKLAREYGVAQTTIIRVVKGQNWVREGEG